MPQLKAVSDVADNAPLVPGDGSGTYGRLLLSEPVVSFAGSGGGLRVH